MENQKIEDGFKPRKWLMMVLIVVSVVIAAYLAYGLIKAYMESEKEDDLIEDNIKKTQERISEAQKKQEANFFNISFESYQGTKYSTSVSLLFDEIITNNKKNSDRLITVVLGDTTTTDPEAIKNLKKQLEEWHKYEISFDYDDNGYIYKAIVEY